MGVAESDIPEFAHLPFVMGTDNAKLSKRNGEVSIAWYREEGFLPEAICNYLALLGWSPGNDRENISMKELTELFTVDRVNSSPARFDMKKLEAINGDKIRALSITEFLERSLPFLLQDSVIKGTETEVSLVRKALPIIQERIIKLSEVVPMLSFLFKTKLEFDEETKSKLIEADSQKVLQNAVASLEALSDWSHTQIEEALRKSLLDGLGLKPRLAFGPVRIAVTGSPISPPLFESMEILGREVSMQRLREAIN